MVSNGCVGSEPQYADSCPGTFHGVFTRGGHTVLVTLTQAITSILLDARQRVNTHAGQDPVRALGPVLDNCLLPFLFFLLQPVKDAREWVLETVPCMVKLQVTLACSPCPSADRARKHCVAGRRRHVPASGCSLEQQHLFGDGRLCHEDQRRHSCGHSACGACMCHCTYFQSPLLRLGHDSCHCCQPHSGTRTPVSPPTCQCGVHTFPPTQLEHSQTTLGHTFPPSLRELRVLTVHGP